MGAVQPEAETRAARLAIVLGCAALVAAVWILAIERIHYERAEAIADAVRQNNNLIVAFEQQTLRAVRAVDAAVLHLRREYATHHRLATPEELAEIGLLDSALVRHFVITDRDGTILDQRGLPAALNLRDRGYFAVLRDDPSAGLVISRPLVGRVGGKPIITLARQISRPDGSFGGVVAVALDPSTFLDAYKALDLGPRGLIQLVGLDGIVRARRVGEEVSFGQDMRDSTILARAAQAPVGSFMSRGNGSDGSPRYQSYRRLAGYPLVVSLGVAEEDVLAGFSARQRFYYAAGAAGSVLLGLLASGLIFWLRQRQRIAAALRERDERFRQMAEHIEDVVFLQNLDGSEMYYASPAYEKIWGRSVDSLFAKPVSWCEAIHPDDRGYALAKFREGRERGFDYEFRIVRVDGEVRWVRVRGFPIRDAMGKPYRTAGVAADITREKLAEMQAADSAQRLLRQIDELRRFQKVTVDRELRMIELEAQLRTLREKETA
jgi:PAS domain S-box-containing protein